MLMKESVASMRAYFAFVGIVGLVNGVLNIMAPAQDLVVTILTSGSLALGIGYLYSSIKFPEYLETSTIVVRTLLYISGGWCALNILVAIAMGLYGVALVVPIVAIIIVWYLFLNVRRLEEEHGLEWEDNQRYRGRSA